MKCTVCGCDRRMLCRRCRDGRCARCEADAGRASRITWFRKVA